jgi:CheY-like chemotaxis protein
VARLVWQETKAPLKDDGNTSMQDNLTDSFKVLIADDSEVDRLLIKDALQHAPRLQLAHEVPDGSQTISYLNGDGEYSDRKHYGFPDLLLLDLYMPVADGFEVLEWLQSQPYDHLCVVVLTDSMVQNDIKRALDLGADLFQVKPHNSKERQDLILALERHLVQSRSTPVRRPRRRTTRSLA